MNFKAYESVGATNLGPDTYRERTSAFQEGRVLEVYQVRTWLSIENAPIDLLR